MKKTLAGLFLLISTSVSAGAYIDIGASYIDSLQIKDTVSLDFNDSSIVAQRITELDVDSWVIMLRVGYKFKSNMVIEYDTYGIQDIQLERINVFYRHEWK